MDQQKPPRRSTMPRPAAQRARTLPPPRPRHPSSTNNHHQPYQRGALNRTLPRRLVSRLSVIHEHPNYQFHDNVLIRQRSDPGPADTTNWMPPAPPTPPTPPTYLNLTDSNESSQGVQPSSVELVRDEYDNPQPGPSFALTPEQSPPSVYDDPQPSTSRASPPNASAVDSVENFRRVCWNRSRYRVSELDPSEYLADMMINISREGYHEGVPFGCFYCGAIPSQPVTGPCGHTWCRNCVVTRTSCRCGVETPSPLTTDVLVQRLLESLTVEERFLRMVLRAISRNLEDENPLSSSNSYLSETEVLRTNYANMLTSLIFPNNEPYDYEVLLQNMDRISSINLASPSNSLLLTESCQTWLMNGDLDCILCCSVYRSPVTTPCGHTYCRTCLERSLDFRHMCPLCSTSLKYFNIDATADTLFIVQAIETVGLSAELAPDGDVWMPLFVCTVAYPMVPCPLFVFEPRYRLMIRRCLRSGQRRFGMITMTSRGLSEYGTILEIRDCIALGDGRSILSTVGMSRFRVLQRWQRDGYDVAKIKLIMDKVPSTSIVKKALRLRNAEMRKKAESWLSQMSWSVQNEIESSFGIIPRLDENSARDGPAWLWWMLAILPLSTDLKVKILATSCLQKRMLAIERTIDVMLYNRQPLICDSHSAAAHLQPAA